ncbi:hypothetical protein [Streptomyces odonnellii]|uniref:hypothetical protein n=1 Tax=Streptomyces odonnellii TaxID=1417980 RepID=UPI000695FD47|nr:hypothetical protein [Streptomyces odonnellii]
MSDYEDDMMETLNRRLGTTYGGLVAVCANLPVPITLPQGVVTNTEIIPAVRRVADISDEQPMPEDQHAQLFTGSVLWLTAADAFQLLIKEGYVESRAAGALGVLMIANDALTDLGGWLLEQMS